MEVRFEGEVFTYSAARFRSSPFTSSCPCVRPACCSFASSRQDVRYIDYATFRARLGRRGVQHPLKCIYCSLSYRVRGKIGKKVGESFEEDAKKYGS